MAEEQENQEQEEPVTNALELSDEEVLAMSEPSFDEPSTEEAPAEEEEPAAEEPAEEEEPEEPAEEEEAEVPAVGEEENPDTAMMEAFNKAVKSEDKKEPEAPAKAEAKEEAESDDKGDQEEKPDTAEINYEAEYKKLTAPFRANGRDVQIKGVDDALTLMKMGANYNKKMAALKPNLKLMKMLSNNDLLDEQKLTYLIDLQKKNPEAIAKFVKESGINPMEIDTESETDEYKPGTYTVDDKDVELDLVLEEIQDSKSFDETIDIISTKWDDSSKKVVLAEPQLIKVINDHVEQGIYGQINQIIESERMLGRLTELTDLEAYKHVGDLLQAKGAFNKSPAPAGDTDEEPAVQKKPTKAKSEDPKLIKRRKAAGSPKGTPKAAVPDFNPLAMSDEEFEKVSANMGI